MHTRLHFLSNLEVGRDSRRQCPWQGNSAACLTSRENVLGKVKTRLFEEDVFARRGRTWKSFFRPLAIWVLVAISKQLLINRQGLDTFTDCCRPFFYKHSSSGRKGVGRLLYSKSKPIAVRKWHIRITCHWILKSFYLIFQHCWFFECYSFQSVASESQW